MLVKKKEMERERERKRKIFTYCLKAIQSIVEVCLAIRVNHFLSGAVKFNLDNCALSEITLKVKITFS